MALFNCGGIIISIFILGRWVSVGKELVQSEVFALISVLFMLGFHLNMMTFWAAQNFQ